MKRFGELPNKSLGATALPNNGMQRTANEQDFYLRGFVAAADAGRWIPLYRFEYAPSLSKIVRVINKFSAYRLYRLKPTNGNL